MPTNQVYLTDERYAKMVYIQEQLNKGKPSNQQETITQIWQRWIEAQIELEEVKPTIDSLTEER